MTINHGCHIKYSQGQNRSEKSISGCDGSEVHCILKIGLTVYHRWQDDKYGKFDPASAIFELFWTDKGIANRQKFVIHLVPT